VKKAKNPVAPTRKFDELMKLQDAALTSGQLSHDQTVDIQASSTQHSDGRQPPSHSTQ
jgi:hypothetical protein